MERCCVLTGGGMFLLWLTQICFTAGIADAEHDLLGLSAEDENFGAPQFGGRAFP